MDIQETFEHETADTAEKTYDISTETVTVINRDYVKWLENRLKAGMRFGLTEKEDAILLKWKDAIKLIYGEYGTFEYVFRPNGIGVVKRVYSDLTDTEIDLTDIDSW